MENIKEYLKTQDINTDNITDNTLEQLYNKYQNYILSYTGIELEKIDTITDISLKKFNYKNYLIKEYPIDEIIEIKVDNNLINPNQYFVNLDSGIIRWKENITGNILTIKYLKRAKKETLNLIENLILDLLTYNLKEDKDIQSIKEGDVSITYNTNNSLSNNIKEKLEDLKNSQYSPKAQMIR